VGHARASAGESFLECRLGLAEIVEIAGKRRQFIAAERRRKDRIPTGYIFEVFKQVLPVGAIFSLCRVGIELHDSGLGKTAACPAVGRRNTLSLDSALPARVKNMPGFTITRAVEHGDAASSAALDPSRDRRIEDQNWSTR
jgi:hypothetical protein